MTCRLSTCLWSTLDGAVSSLFRGQSRLAPVEDDDGVGASGGRDGERRLPVAEREADDLVVSLGRDVADADGRIDAHALRVGTHLETPLHAACAQRRSALRFPL